MNAIFLTEKEALDYINATFGIDATTKIVTLDDSTRFDINEMPFTWSGEVSAYEVDEGAAYVAFWESKDNKYTASCGGLEVEADSLWGVREVIVPKFTEAAEKVNFAGEITISERNEVIDIIKVEPMDLDKPLGSCDEFKRAFESI